MSLLDAAAAAAASRVTLAVNTSLPLHTLDPTFLSFNIDTASLYTSIDLTSGKLINLVGRLAPAVIRVGGTAADSAFYTAASASRGGDGKGHTLINNAAWEEVLSFIAATNTTLLWNLNGAAFRTPRGSWDPARNATAFLEYTQSAGHTGISWSIGNEPEVWSPPVNGSQLGADALTLSAQLRGYTVGSRVAGASFAWYDPAAIQLFFEATRGGSIDALTVHQYPLDHGKECNLVGALNRSNTERLVPTFDGTVALRAAHGDPSVKLVLEETAGSSGGGCPNITDR